MKKIYVIAILSFSFLFSIQVSGQNIIKTSSMAGSWLGKLNTGAIELRVIFNLSLIGKDSLIATLDSPDQGARDIPCGQVTLDKQKLVIKAPVINGEYNGVVTGDSTINGTWTQNGGSLPLNLKKQGKQK